MYKNTSTYKLLQSSHSASLARVDTNKSSYKMSKVNLVVGDLHNRGTRSNGVVSDGGVAASQNNV